MEALIRQFEAHHLAQIRQAINDYREKYNVGDSTIASELLAYLPPQITYESTLKNVQRLRRGERLRGAPFLNACVEFLTVKLVDKTNRAQLARDFAQAMQRFIGPVFSGPGLWGELEGHYMLEVHSEAKAARPFDARSAGRPAQGIAVDTRAAPGSDRRAFAILSLTDAGATDHAVVRERYFFTTDSNPAADQPQIAEAEEMERQGICLPLSSQAMLIVIRDFLFSQLYTVSRDRDGFTGTMMMPLQFGSNLPDFTNQPSAQYDVALHKLSRA